MTVPAKVTLVTLGVPDVTRSTAFYQALAHNPAWPLGRTGSRCCPEVG